MDTIKLRGAQFIFLLLCITGGVACFASDGPVVIYGDTRTNHAIHRKIVAAIMRHTPSVALHVGDLVENGREPADWAVFNEISAELLKTAEFYSALGNHEMDSPLYFQNFHLPGNGRWYSIERQGIHFIVLDSGADLSAGSEQYRWLESDLKNVKSKATFKIALFHYPLFSCGSHPTDGKRLRPVLLPLFKKYGVNAVFSGHDHNYQRFFYGGMYFIVTGGGGAPLHAQHTTNPFLQKFIETYNFCVLTQEGSRLIVRVFDADLTLIDTFVIPALQRTPKRSDPVLFPSGR